eukprot:g33102.t1
MAAITASPSRVWVKERPRAVGRSRTLKPPGPTALALWSKTSQWACILACCSKSGYHSRRVVLICPLKDPLSDEVVTQIAQSKYEAQEDKLKDVARHSMALIRDFHKMDEQDCFRKIADIQRCLVKYEMQYIRAWEIEDKRRQRELLDLEAMRLRFRKEGEAEESQLEGQREVLQKGLAKRKRYEGYEELSASVNTKRPQHESKAQIQKLTVELQQMEQQQKRLAELSQHRDEPGGLSREATDDGMGIQVATPPVMGGPVGEVPFEEPDFQDWEMAHETAGDVEFVNSYKVGAAVVKIFVTRQRPALVVAHDCDLALLEVRDPRCFEGATPMELLKPQEMLEMQSRVQVMGFPIGGDYLSITEGVLSRIEVVDYSHSRRSCLALTVDAAINAGNSGGPVVDPLTGRMSLSQA